MEKGSTGSKQTKRYSWIIYPYISKENLPHHQPENTRESHKDSQKGNNKIARSRNSHNNLITNKNC